MPNKNDGRGRWHRPKNQVRIDGDVSYVELRRKDGTILDMVMDTADIPMLSYIGRLSPHHDIGTNEFYAVFSVNRGRLKHNTSEKFHRWIVRCPAGKVVDHINGNGLDNRRANLRCVSHAINCLNKREGRSNNTSGSRGVYPTKSGKWRTDVTALGVRYRLGTYATREQASEVVKKLLDSVVEIREQALGY